MSAWEGMTDAELLAITGAPSTPTTPSSTHPTAPDTPLALLHHARPPRSRDPPHQPRGSEEGVDSFSLTAEVGVGHRGCSVDPAAYAARDRLGHVYAQGSSRRDLRARSMFRHTRATTVVSHPSRFSTPPASARLTRSQASRTASSASLREPRIRAVAAGRLGMSAP